ncbi:FAD-dependent oxidoreductase [Halopiger xanaduensis]|uniref:Glycerol-3-phosphate dehydrogenase n=1 Tax=Halopiger xanaduensis (strain DSM 18323 / JCM 14033 / SH-6) TaxID=797210 RepID=F8D397_HALXS|nr:FAD-dependent oxidoreductase [Halopiger xanaduensis]AEH38529.1 Glycerol-3-phosphate dehydrogenase [Halopiger xanaduensis SH-6]
MPIETDVLVVGGGATGAGTARDLALRGLDVALVDRAGLSAGTSSRSHGLCHSGARYAESDPAGAEECIQERQILGEVAGACVRDTGGLFLELEADDPDYFAAKREACEKVGIPTTVLEGGKARAEVPALSPNVQRALSVPDAVIYPSRIVAANAAAARNEGAQILTHAPVEGMRLEGDRIAAVELGGQVDDTVEADFVVNAAGAWAGRVAAMAEVDVEMQPNRGVMVSVRDDALEPATMPVLNRCRDPADGDIVVPHEDEVVLGTTSVDVDDPDEYETAEWELERVREECARMLPPVADAEDVRTWWGVRPLYAPDEATRESRGISRGFFLLDHAADGVANFASIVGGKLTTYRAMAEATADLVCERLGVDEPCVTADRRLPGADDSERLDAFVAEFDAGGPSDADVVSTDRGSGSGSTSARADR